MALLIMWWRSRKYPNRIWPSWVFIRSRKAGSYLNAWKKIIKQGLRTHGEYSLTDALGLYAEDGHKVQTL